MGATGRRGGFNPLVAGFIAGVALALILGLLAKINLDFAAPWSRTHTLTADVSNVDGISVGSDVRIAGRLVGQITAVESRGTYSAVTFHVDDADWPLPRETSASIRLATLLGQKYIQLVPGPNSSQALADNGTIGLPSTSPVVDFDQVLDTFDKPTRDSLTSLIRTVGSAVQGQEGTLQQLLPDLRDLSVHSVIPTGELVTRNAEINNILVNLGTTADQLNASGSDLVGVIDNMNSITGALATHQAALEGYIANTGALNQTTNAVLGNGGAAKLNAGFQRLSSFADQLTTLMNTLVPETYAFTHDTGPATGRPVYQDATNLTFQIGSATAQSDLDGFFLRQNANAVDPCGLLGPTCVVTNTPASNGSAAKSGGSGAVCVPPLPCLPVPPLTVPSVPGLPSLAPPTAGPAPSGGGGTLPPLPTGVPLLSSDTGLTPSGWLGAWTWL